jgi:aspartyl-tRNA(Asn)/glutamyl-tRNA(Gln) amidotransferase subunit C
MSMSVDQASVQKIARLARIRVAPEEVPHIQGEINAILAFVDELSRAPVDNVEPMTSVIPMRLPLRADVATDHAGVATILANAPEADAMFFIVPRVVE